jgi:hypothetical protein
MRGVIEFESTGNVAVHFGGNWAAWITTGVRYNSLFAPYSQSGMSASPSTANYHIVSAPGNVTGMATKCDDTVAGGIGYKIFIFKNGVKQDGAGATVNTELYLQGVSAGTVVTNSFTLPVVVGDYLYTDIEPTASCPLTNVNFGCKFEPTTAGYKNYGAQEVSAISGSTTQYLAPTGEESAPGWSTDATEFKHFIECGVTPILINRSDWVISAVTPTGKSHTFTFQKNEVDTDIVVIFTDSFASSNDTGTCSLVDGDTLRLKHVPAGTPASTNVAFGYALTETPEEAAPEPIDPNPPGGVFPPGLNPFSGEFVGLTWAEWTHVSTSGTPNTYLWAPVDLIDDADYYGGYKEARILSYGRIRRALSDDRGQFETAQFSIIMSDTDRLIRGLLASANSKYFLNRMIVLRMIDDYNRRLEAVPRTIARGILRNYKPLSPLYFEMIAEDFISSKFSVANLDKQIPQRIITRADFADAPSEIINWPVPIIYGSVVEEVADAAPPVLQGNQDKDRGAFFVSDHPYHEAYPPTLWVMGWGDMDSPPGPPTSVSGVPSAGGSISEDDIVSGDLYLQVTAVNSTGDEGDPHIFNTNATTIIDLTGMGSGLKIDCSATYPGGAAAGWALRFYLGMDLFNIITQVNNAQMIEVAYPTTTCTFDKHPKMGEEPTPDNIATGAQLIQHWVGRFYAVTAVVGGRETGLSPVCFAKSAPYRRKTRIEWITVSGATAYNVYAKDSHRGQKATDEPTSKFSRSSWNRKWTTANTYFEDDFLDTDVTFINPASVGPTGAVPLIFCGFRTADDGSRWHQYLIAGHAIKEISAIFVEGARVDPSSYGQQALVPGQTGYSTFFSGDAGSPQYRDINGHRYTFIYGRGPVSDQVAKGEKLASANVLGLEDVGDGSGDAILNIHQQYKHAVKNWFFQSYESGDWLTAPNWPEDPNGDIVSQVYEDSFDDCEVISTTAMSGAPSTSGAGFVGAFVMGNKGERLTLRDWIARLNTSGDCECAFNDDSQFFISMFDPNADTSATILRAYTPTDHIVKDSLDIVDKPEWLENVMHYSYLRDWAADIWEAEDYQHRDAESITNWQEERSAPELELWCIRNAEVASEIISRRMIRRKDITRLLTFSTTFAGLSTELGDLILVSHYEGIGASGWESRVFRVIRHETDPQKYMVHLECVDVTDWLGT